MTIFKTRIIKYFFFVTIIVFSNVKLIAQQNTLSWEHIFSSPITYSFPRVNTFIGSGSKLITGSDLGIYISLDDGKTWVASNNGLPINDKNKYPFGFLVNFLMKTGNTIFAATEQGVWKSNDGAQTWVNAGGGVLDNQTVLRLVVNQGILFATAYSGGNYNTLQVYRSGDSGQTWSNKSGGLPVDTAYIQSGYNLVSASNTVFVLTPTKLYSLDDGEIWSAKALPESVVGFALLTATDSVLYIRSGTGALWRSGNKGQTWETVSVPNSFQGGAYNILASGNHLALVYNVSIHGFQYATHFIYSFDAGKTFSNNIGPISNNRSNFTQNVALIDNRIFLWLVDPLTVESNLYRSNILSPIATPVSAANYQIGSLASESIASVFGTGLALKTASANGGTLPTNLENTTVTITDNVGNIKAAPLFYVSPTQINFQLPTGLANGVGIVSISLYNQTVATGVVAIANTAPGLFSANQTGAGLAAANVQRVAANGASTYQPIAQFDAAAQKFVALPINVNAGLDQAYLNLYGTGIRGRSDLATVKATIGGTVVPVTYAGPHGSFVGVDQINILLPSTLRGKGENEIILTVDNQISNKVKIVIQ